MHASRNIPSERRTVDQNLSKCGNYLMPIIEKRPYTATAMLLAALLILPSCLGSYGRIKSNPAVTEVFMQAELPDYNYYYCGRKNQGPVISRCSNITRISAR